MLRSQRNLGKHKSKDRHDNCVTNTTPKSEIQQKKLDTSCRKRQLSPHPATLIPAVVPKSDFI